jgi:hypothetical protein
MGLCVFLADDSTLVSSAASVDDMVGELSFAESSCVPGETYRVGARRPTVSHLSSPENISRRPLVSLQSTVDGPLLPS